MLGTSGIEVKLSERVISGLIMLNEDRKNAQKDKSFIKALLIGVNAMKDIKESKTLPKETIAFIKGM